MKPNWFNRNQRLRKRKENLGERYTSNLTTRKFITESLKDLNLKKDFTEIEYIYEIGWCGGKQKHINRLKYLIKSGQFVKISKLNGDGVEWVQDDLGDNPVGEYADTYLNLIMGL